MASTVERCPGRQPPPTEQIDLILTGCKRDTWKIEPIPERDQVSMSALARWQQPTANSIQRTSVNHLPTCGTHFVSMRALTISRQATKERIYLSFADQTFRPGRVSSMFAVTLPI